MNANWCMDEAEKVLRIARDAAASINDPFQDAVALVLIAEAYMDLARVRKDL